MNKSEWIETVCAAGGRYVSVDGAEYFLLRDEVGFFERYPALGYFLVPVDGILSGLANVFVLPFTPGTVADCLDALGEADQGHRDLDLIGEVPSSAICELIEFVNVVPSRPWFAPGMEGWPICEEIE